MLLEINVFGRAPGEARSTSRYSIYAALYFPFDATKIELLFSERILS